MKDSGIEWIGEIPEGWEVKKIGTCYSERNTKVSDKDYPPLSVTKNGILPQLETAAKTDNGENRKLVCSGDFVINSRSDRKGSCGISKLTGSTSLINIVLSPQQEINNYYFSFVFKSTMFADEFFKWGNGIVDDLWSTKWSSMKKISVPFPPLTEQQRIADYLDAKCAHIDQCLELTRQSMEKLRAYKLSCITEAVTKGLDPDVPLKDSGVPWIGQIPAGWENKRLRYLGTCQNGISKAGEFFGHGKPFISYKDVYLNITLPQNTNSLIDSTESERNLYSVKEGDIFFTRTSETIEEIGFASTCINTIENACFAGFLIRFRPHRGILNKHFGKYYFRNSALRSYFSQMNIVTRASLSQEILKNLPVLLPPLPEQERIAAYLDKKCARIDALLEEKQALLDKLAEYKKSLIFEYVTGKREVPSCWNR